MAEKKYDVGEHSLSAEQLGNVFVQWYATVKNDMPVEDVAKQMKGVSAAYLNDVLEGKKVVDGRHAPGFVAYFKQKTVRLQVEEYLRQYASGNMDIDVRQSRALKQIAEGVSALVDQDANNKKAVDGLGTRVDGLEESVNDVSEKVADLPKDVASKTYVNEQRKEAEKGYEKQVKDAVKPLATTKYVDDAVKGKQVDPEAFKLMDEAEATLDKLLKKLDAKKKKK